MQTLEIQHLSKSYDNDVEALKEVSLSISKGIFGLLGPNGAGKSTLMQIVATLLKADSGTISFNGTDIFDNPHFLRQRLGYLPQEFGVYPNMSAFRLLDYLAILKGINRKTERMKQVNALLEQTNLYAQRNRAVSTFSGGMRQRFGIAQTLLGEPELIIVDEPTAGLDPEERNRFHNLLSEIGEQVIIMLSTHIVEDVRNLSSQMAILGDGRILQQGNPAELVKRLEGQVWQKIVSKNEVDEYRRRMEVISYRLHAGNTEIRVLADQPPEAGFEPGDPDLKDFYFATLRQSDIISH